MADLMDHCIFDGRCCTTLISGDSCRESMRLDDTHEQAITRPVPHDELVQLHLFAVQARVATDLAGQGDDLTRTAWRQTRSPWAILRCGDPVLSDDQVSAQVAAPANDLDGGQPADVG